MALVRSPRWGRFFVIEKRDCQLRPPLRCRRAAIEKLANGCDKLGWRERLGQKEAVRDAMRGPLVGTSTGHVDDGKIWIDLPGMLGDFPSVHSAPQFDVGHECPVVAAPVSP